MYSVVPLITVLIVIITTNAQVSCISRNSITINITAGSEVSVTCDATLQETLTDCGFQSVYDEETDVAGSYHSNNNTCVAKNKNEYSTPPHDLEGVIAIARCCTLPSTIECKAVQGTGLHLSNDKSYTECTDGDYTTLTGCSVSRDVKLPPETGDQPEIEGAYSTSSIHQDITSILSPNDTIQCYTSGDGLTSFKIYPQLTCCKTSTDTPLNCTTRYGSAVAVPGTSSVICSSGELMLGCSGYASSTILINAWYITDTPTIATCNARAATSTGSAEVYSAAICCVAPTPEPTVAPSTSSPTYSPTNSPSFSPSNYPSSAPSTSPSLFPSNYPSYSPSSAPSYSPSTAPSNAPSYSPSNAPSNAPSLAPSASPTNFPSRTPSYSPSLAPSTAPSSPPTAAPSNSPSLAPSAAPSNFPSRTPSNSPSLAPSAAPSNFPTRTPSHSPSSAPSTAPSSPPSAAPSNAPSYSPSGSPSAPPTAAPSNAPSFPPTAAPSAAPSIAPSNAPTYSPANAPSNAPSLAPSLAPSNAPSLAPSNAPSLAPSLAPSNAPSAPPTTSPSDAPTQPPTYAPTPKPTNKPTPKPSGSIDPTASPSTPRPTRPPTVSDTIVAFELSPELLAYIAIGFGVTGALACLFGGIQYCVIYECFGICGNTNSDRGDKAINKEALLEVLHLFNEDDIKEDELTPEPSNRAFDEFEAEALRELRRLRETRNEVL